MMEPIFGAGSPAWTGVPQSAFGWLAAGTPTPQLPAFQNSGEPAASFGAAGPFGAIANGSSYVGPLPAAELSMVPAPALLATIAMRRGQLQGPTTDTEIEEFLYDAIDLLAGSTDVEVHSEGGRATLTGTVSQKRLKRDIGEIAWALPRVNDVQNNVTIAARRRSRTSSREADVQTQAAGRKSA